MGRRRKFNKPIAPPPTRHIVVISFLFFLIFTMISLLIINNGIKPVLLDIAETKTQQIANEALGVAVNKKISEDLQAEELVQKQVDREGRPVNYIFNTVVQNRVQRNVQYRVQNFLKQLENGNIPDPGMPLDVEIEQEEETALENVKNDDALIEIPLGQTLGIPLLAQLGPDIPVKVDMIGFVSTEVDTSLVETGINGAYIKVNVHIEVELSVIIPFASRPTKVVQDIPVTEVFHPGEVPEFYNDGGGAGGSDPDFSIPIDPLQ